MGGIKLDDEEKISYWVQNLEGYGFVCCCLSELTFSHLAGFGM